MSIVAPLFLSKRSGRFPMRPTVADVRIARTIARRIKPAPDEVARLLTWGADEKLLLPGWLATRGKGEPLRRAGNHALLVPVASALTPHVLKLLFNQTRPDRETVVGNVHGVSLSERREDAFPSGHALHIGALASAAGSLGAGPRRIVRALAIGLSLTTIVVMAHCASDVVAGFALGAVIERLLRLWTGYPNRLPDPAIVEICEPRKDRADGIAGALLKPWQNR
jgi:membrane-associated phospholipid phosphatase